jgi:hypothetical protein
MVPTINGTEFVSAAGRSKDQFDFDPFSIDLFGPRASLTSFTGHRLAAMPSS